MYTVAVIGLGYVGLPLSLVFAEAGMKVIGLDIDPLKVDSLNDGRSYIEHVDAHRIRSARYRGIYTASTDFSHVKEADAVILCVPTPLNKHREPDLSYVLKTAEAVAPHLRPQTLVVLESTTFPGTTEDELRTVLEEISGMKAGDGFFLAYSPEREDPGNAASHAKAVPKILGGYTPRCLERAQAIYGQAIENIVPVASCRIAEAAKLTENIFRAVNIALVNELKVVYTKMGIDIWEVIEAAKTKPFGYMPFYPGPGLGGHCIPIDPFYLTWKAREFEQHTRFIELAGEINASMPDYVVGEVTRALNDEGKAVRGSRILILGLAYKPGVDDYRESPSFDLMRKLQKMGATVDYNDPHVSCVSAKRDYPEFQGLRSVPISKDYDLLLLATHHEAYRQHDFSDFDVPIVDTRNFIEKRNMKYYKA